MMFVEQQMELVEGGPGYLPVMLLVQVAQRHGVREQLVEVFDALFARRLGERDGHANQVAPRLNLMAFLMGHRRGVLQNFIGIQNHFRHRSLLFSVTSVSSVSTSADFSQPSNAQHYHADRGVVSFMVFLPNDLLGLGCFAHGCRSTRHASPYRP